MEFGPYLSERQWGTVREDYSADGEAWEYFPHDHARSRAYRWGEDGLLGISDRRQRLCFALALWNGADAILKERLFGLTGHQGNHGEDVKEYYFYLDALPSHAYLKALYKYPQRAFPYEQLIEENARRTRLDPEYELVDTAIFGADRYFDVFVEYARGDTSDDVCILFTIANRANEAADLHVLPTLWYRNVWSWDDSPKPQLAQRTGAALPTIGADTLELVFDRDVDLLFTENETNLQRLFNVPSPSPYVKDGINDFIVNGAQNAVNPQGTGTKAAGHYRLHFGPGEQQTIRLRLSPPMDMPFRRFDEIVEERRAEADAYYASILPYPIDDDRRAVHRQALAGTVWSKQLYHWNVARWLEGDPAQPPPPPQRLRGRDRAWTHFNADEILAMPDKWEYPWFAAWDLAVQAIPLSMIDLDFAKQQLITLGREWYMHPNGQIPAYEWAFGDSNPPLQAWAAYRLFKIERKQRGEGDYLFLERVFQKLLMNFTWWVNRKDQFGRNIFQGGFLGLDNIGLFNRSSQLPGGGYLNQSDGTSWMAFYALSMLAIAIELALHNKAYEDITTKFFEHFLYIADAMNHVPGGRRYGLWNEEDRFYYDVLVFPDGSQLPLKVRSMVGLIPLLAVETIEPETLERLPEFGARMDWFIKHKPELCSNVSHMDVPGMGDRRLVSIVSPEKLRHILAVMLDENEFLSPYGIRSLSRYHAAHPYSLQIAGQEFSINYEPAESTTGLFGGNSNWRGPIWFPMNYLLIEALQRFHYYLGAEYRVEYPAGSGQQHDLWEVATGISHRLMSIFSRGENGLRPVFADSNRFQHDPHWRDYVPFYEYFHGDTGAGLGASHQTGWTALVAKLILQCAQYCGQGKTPTRPS